MLNCPDCKSDYLGDRWVGRGRNLAQFCYDCGWEGSHRTPEQREVQSVKEVSLGTGFYYEVFDCYGHPMISSRTYPTEEAAMKDLVIVMNDYDNETGPYTAVLWPATAVITGKCFTQVDVKGDTLVVPVKP